MRKIKCAFIALVCLLLAAVVLLFTLENRQAVELSFLGWNSPAVPQAMAVLVAFVAGAFFAGLTFWLPLGHARRKNARQARQLAKLQEQLQEQLQAPQQPASTELAVTERAA